MTNGIQSGVAAALWHCLHLCRKLHALVPGDGDASPVKMGRCGCVLKNMGSNVLDKECLSPK